MDLGIFKRRRATFWAWIVLPALCVVVVHYAFNVYCMCVEERLQQRRAVLGILDDVEERMRVAKDVVCGFEILGDGPASAADDISTRISELGRRHAFMINSLRVQDLVTEKKKEATPSLTIGVDGQGDMFAIMEFLNELQSPQHLTVVDEATLQMERRAGSDARSYQAKLTLRCFRDALKGGRND